MLGGPTYIIQILLLCTKHIQNKKEKYKKVQPFSSYERSKEVNGSPKMLCRITVPHRCHCFCRVSVRLLVLSTVNVHCQRPLSPSLSLIWSLIWSLFLLSSIACSLLLKKKQNFGLICLCYCLCLCQLISLC